MFYPSWIPISMGVRSWALDEQHVRNGEPLPLLWFVGAKTVDGRNHDIPRLDGDEALWLGESLNCWRTLILAEDKDTFGSVWEDDLVVGVGGVLARLFWSCLNECEKRCDFKRRTASLIRLPSSIRRCNKLGRRRFLSLGQRLLWWWWWWWWWWCDVRFDFDDFHELVAEPSVFSLCNGSILPDWSRFKLTFDDDDGAGVCCCCCCCWLKWRRQPERNRRISVNLS